MKKEAKSLNEPFLKKETVDLMERVYPVPTQKPRIGPLGFENANHCPIHMILWIYTTNSYK